MSIEYSGFKRVSGEVMEKVILPGFSESNLESRIVKSDEELSEWINVSDCNAQVYMLSYKPDFVNELHKHEQIRLTFIRSGRIRFTIDDTTKELGTGDFITIPANVLHKFEILGDETFRVIEVVIPANCKDNINKL